MQASGSVTASSLAQGAQPIAHSTTHPPHSLNTTSIPPSLPCHSHTPSLCSSPGLPQSRSVLELPYFSKYLLIAAYLASYNPSKTDKKFFSKVRLVFTQCSPCVWNIFGRCTCWCPGYLGDRSHYRLCNC